MSTPPTHATDAVALPPRSWPFRTVAFMRAHLAFIAVMAVGTVLRAWHLGAIPTPAGDEGNWSALALGLLRNRAGGLPADANFVTRAYAWMIAGSFRLFGLSFASARLVPAVCGLLGALVAYITLRAMKMRRGALVVATVVAIHPWSVAFSRTVSVPYELSFVIAVCAPLLVLYGIESRRRALCFAGILLLFVGFQFSPLAVLGAVAVFLDSFRRPRRIAWRWPETWVAVALGVAITIPVVLAALHVASTNPFPRDPSWGWRTDLLLRMLRIRMYTHAVATSVTGDATVREFTTWVLPRSLEFMLVVWAFGVVALGVQRTVRRRSAVGAFAPLYLAVAFVGVGVMLSPARHWYLNTIDADRYGFAILAPFTLLLAASVEHPRTWRRALVIAFVAVTISNATTRLATYFVVGGGTDHELYTWRSDTWDLCGSGYRWWIVPREREALPDLVHDAVVGSVGRRPVVLMSPDYTFRALSLPFLWENVPVELLRAPPTEPTDRPQFVVLWSDGAFSSAPRDVVANNATLRSRMEHEYCTRRLVRRWVQPNGAPFVELWQAVPCPIPRTVP